MDRFRCAQENSFATLKDIFKIFEETGNNSIQIFFFIIIIKKNIRKILTISESDFTRSAKLIFFFFLFSFVVMCHDSDVT